MAGEMTTKEDTNTFVHHAYDDVIIEVSTSNSDKVDDMISRGEVSCVYRGDYSWAFLFNKLTMLGFSCHHRGENHIQIREVYCPRSDIEAFDALVDSLDRIEDNGRETTRKWRR